MNARDGAKFWRLFGQGDTSGYASGSEADAAFMALLAFWTDDTAQMDRLYRCSALMREKWDSRRGESTYGALEIVRALDRRHEHYQGSRANAARISAFPSPLRMEGEHSPHDVPIDADRQDPPVASGAFNLTELGNAERLMARHSKNLRFCFPWKAWLVWDGKRWKVDDTGHVFHLAQETVRSIYAEAAAEEDDKARKAIADHARRSESDKATKAMISHVPAILNESRALERK